MVHAAFAKERGPEYVKLIEAIAARGQLDALSAPDLHG